MRASLFVVVAALALACDASTSPPFTLRIYIGGDEGLYDVTVDDVAVPPLDAIPEARDDVFLVERTYPSYAAALEAAPIEAAILDRTTGSILATDQLGPGACERLGVTDLTYEEQSHEILPDHSLGGGCVQCRGESGAGGSSCP